MFKISTSLIINIFIGLIALTLVVLITDKVINRSIKVSRKLGISELFIGLTIISIGTSLPEIIMHIVASLDIVRHNIDPFVASAVVLGINVGSDIVQQTLIIGIVALIGAIYVKKSFLKKDFSIMIFAAVLLLLFSLDGKIDRKEGFILFFGYLIYLWFLWLKEKERMKNDKNHEKTYRSRDGIFYDLSFIAIGLVVIIISAEYILRVAQFFVDKYNIGGSLIGVFTIGIAAALPELTTSVTAALRGSSSISIGTLIGSNITNPMFALGLGALISGYNVPRSIIVYDLPVKIGTAIVILWFFWKHKALSKKEAVIMIGMYIAYALIRLKYFPVDFGFIQ